MNVTFVPANAASEGFNPIALRKPKLYGVLAFLSATGSIAVFHRVGFDGHSF